MKDKKYMGLAINLASKGVGYVNPNPLVGAIILKNGRIIGKGYHQKYGGLHAEVNAIRSCSSSPKGATMYVTLEPCSYYGKTPPCVEAIIESGIKEVYVACLDPNPKVSGKGVQMLKESGIKVTTGILEEECRKQNEIYFHFLKNKTPFVTMKYAMTIDGKIASSKGESRWITGEEARRRVHQERNRHSGIMVGIGTVLCDDPMLTCRKVEGKDPIRIICDTQLRTPLDSRIVKSAKDIRTLIATASLDENRQKAYKQAGCEIIRVPLSMGHLNLNVLMKKLGDMKIDSILLEGGSSLNFSALKSKIVNQVHTYIAPKILAGDKAKSPVGGLGFSLSKTCVKLQRQRVFFIGDDILIESEVK